MFGSCCCYVCLNEIVFLVISAATEKLAEVIVLHALPEFQLSVIVLVHVRSPLLGCDRPSDVVWKCVNCETTIECSSGTHFHTQ